MQKQNFENLLKSIFYVSFLLPFVSKESLKIKNKLHAHIQTHTHSYFHIFIYPPKSETFVTTAFFLEALYIMLLVQKSIPKTILNKCLLTE